MNHIIAFSIPVSYTHLDVYKRQVQVYQNTVNEDILWSFLRTVLIMIGITGTVILLVLSYMLTGKALTPIRETWKRQREFVADASHELRTPLTVIQTNLDVVLSDEDGTVDEDVYKRQAICLQARP